MYECPKCSSIMSFDEMDWGCFCCGYTRGDSVDPDDWGDDDDDYEPLLDDGD